MSLKSARGRAKNTRNQLQAMRTAVYCGQVPDEESVEYAIEEVKAAIEEIENEIED